MQIQPERCCICNDNKPFYGCNQCNESKICIDCIQNLMEFGHASKCPVCRKKTPWCVQLEEDKEQKSSYYCISKCFTIKCSCPQCLTTKEIYERYIQWKIDNQEEIKFTMRILALLGICLILYCIGIGWAALYKGCITTCDNWYKNSLEHILRGALIVFIFSIGFILIGRVCKDCYNERIPCGISLNILWCICNIPTCFKYLCVQLGIYIKNLCIKCIKYTHHEVRPE